MGSGEEKVENPQTTVEGSEGDDVEGNDETTETVLTEETTEANNDEINVEEKDDDVHESDSDDKLEGSGEEKVENPQTTVEGSEGDDVEGNDETTETVLTEETTQANNDEIKVEEKDDNVHESDSDDNLEGSGEEKMENPQTTREGALGCKEDADCEEGKKC